MNHRGEVVDPPAEKGVWWYVCCVHARKHMANAGLVDGAVRCHYRGMKYARLSTTHF
jgi:hypothetical protein